MAKFKGVFKHAEKYLQLPRIKRLALKSGPSQGSWNTPSIRREKMRVTIRSKQEADAMRDAFGAAGGPRDQFLERVRKEASVTDLQGMGWSNDEIKDFREKKLVPDGFDVHHRIPLKAGGTNDQSNLILIKRDPDHKLISAQQNAQWRGMAPGTSADLDLAMHPPDALTWPKPGERAYR